MNDAEYEQLLENTVKRVVDLAGQRDVIETELAKLAQFIYATANLLSDDAKRRFEERWMPQVQKANAAVASLTDSIREVLSGCYPKALTASQVRDQLRVEGFDFSSYTSDPLPSVSTTLRRLKTSGEINSDEYEGVAIYRAKPPKPNVQPVRLASGQKVAGRAFYGEYPGESPREKK